MARFDDPCTYFTVGKVKASTLSLTVLVIIEMLNAFNAVSEDGSLLQMAPWVNPWLVAACMGQGPGMSHVSLCLIHFNLISGSVVVHFAPWATILP